VIELGELEQLSALLRKKNEIDLEISHIIGRPGLPSHIGEFIASRIFGIRLETSASAKGIDGVFSEGPLKGETVNVKLYGKQEGILDITTHSLADYYLVLTGPKSAPATSKGATQPLVIDHVYLFEMKTLVKNLTNRNLRLSVATSVAKHYWDQAEIYPDQNNKELILTEEQLRQLRPFGT
jgi:hypothetical protein